MIVTLETKRTMTAIDDFLQVEEIKEQERRRAKKGKR